MKQLKILLIVFLSVIFPFITSACSNKDPIPETKDFVGIAYYQKLDGNLNWTKFSKKPNAINNIISTKDNKIVLDEDPELLFFIYTQNKITQNTTNSDFLSNTTRDSISISNNTISFRAERMIEDTEILIYYIYKLKDSTYYLEYKETKINITKTTENFEFEITHELFSKITLTLETNLTINSKY